MQVQHSSGAAGSPGAHRGRHGAAPARPAARGGCPPQQCHREGPLLRSHLLTASPRTAVVLPKFTSLLLRGPYSTASKSSRWCIQAGDRQRSAGVRQAVAGEQDGTQLTVERVVIRALLNAPDQALQLLLDAEQRGEVR